MARTPKTTAADAPQDAGAKPKATRTKAAVAPVPSKLPPLDLSLSAAAQNCKAWPFEEARKIVARLERENKGQKPAKPRTVLFETGYGPSGLPHIGTFGEVARTTMVRTAFRC